MKTNSFLSNQQDTPEEGDLFSFLTRIFYLNEEERFRAGIYIGYEGQRWINQAALVLPLTDEDEISTNTPNPWEK